jgi:hypothetical protein
VSKYGGGNRGFELERLGLPVGVSRDLEMVGNHGIAKGTWSTYATALKMLEKCCEQSGIELIWPVTEKTILTFVHWLLKVRKVGGSTIEAYLAGIRNAHIVRGWPAPPVRTDLINLIIRGKKNIQAAEKRVVPTPDRQPITPDILALLKARLGTWDAPPADKRGVWAVASVCFHGAFRLGELLCKSESVFDPQYALLGMDTDIDTSYSENGCKGVCRIRIKSPKEDKINRSLIVDVFGTGENLCPVKAMAAWRAAGGGGDPELPLFRLTNGKLLTPRKFMVVVRSRLRGYLDGVDRSIAGHSFRIGLASMLAALGYSEADIKAMGRWSSRAWLEYVKHPRTLRIEVAQTIRRR